MSNTMGKVLLGMKKAGEVISKSASEVGTAVGVVGLELGEKAKKSATTLSDKAKKTAKVAMLKAEIDDLYKDLGKCIFNNGIVMAKAGEVAASDEALAIMDILFLKHDELEALESELNKGDSCTCDSDCTCDDSCDCDLGCHCNKEEQTTEDTETKE